MHVWRSLMIGGSESESESGSGSNQRYRKKEREKTNKIINRSAIVTVHINRSAIVTVHICTVTIAIVHKCTILHPLMWVFFEPNCVKGLHFSILQNYPLTDVIALNHRICHVLY